MKHKPFVCLVIALVGVFSHPLVVAQSITDFEETVSGVRFVMKAIPGGRFFMGCGEEDGPCADTDWADKSNNVRQRLVEVLPFYLAETETTWALYQLCINENVCADNLEDGGDNGWGKGLRPVIEVSWDEINTQFLPWLKNKTGKAYRLPSEKEWEYAARAGSTSRYGWGNTNDCSKARYGYQSNECGSQLSTDPVKQYPPNAFGLFDMLGNVWEFTSDCWQSSSAPLFSQIPPNCQERTLRGGSWLNTAQDIRIAKRASHDRSYRESGDGFRLALDN